MKKILSMIIIISLSVNLFALDLEALSAEQRYQYLKNSLSIDFDTITESSAVGTSYYGVAVASGKAKNKTVWTPYYGEQAISKADFFRIVGEDKLAIDQELIDRNNKKNNTIANSLYGAGFGIAGVGLIIELISLMRRDYSYTDADLLYTGIGIALGGLAIASIGIPFEFKAKQDLNISTNFVIGISENYNLRLYASLTK
jgi:hypothetical protein